MKRAAPSKPKNLESLFTKETERHRRSMSRGPGGVIALMRSVTTPMLKREGSEPASMTSIPRGDSSDHAASRPSSATTTKRKTEEKAKKEAQVQAELQDAINGLRKPNREVVGKALAEATERRATTSLSSLRSKFMRPGLRLSARAVLTLRFQNPRSPFSTPESRMLSRRRLSGRDSATPSPRPDMARRWTRVKGKPSRWACLCPHRLHGFSHLVPGSAASARRSLARMVRNLANCRPPRKGTKRT